MTNNILPIESANDYYFQFKSVSNNQSFIQMTRLIIYLLVHLPPNLFVQIKGFD